MAHQYGAFQTTGEGETNDVPQLVQIRQMLRGHDIDGRISDQIQQSLINDGVTLTILSQFDDLSLQQMIDSWNLNTFDKKSFLIRGLIINGIKNLAKQAHHDKDNNNNHACGSGTRRSSAFNALNTNRNDNKSLRETRMRTIVSEVEVQMLDNLINYEKLIVKQLENAENELKETEEKENKLIEKQNQEIEQIFEELVTRLTNRKQFLLSQSRRSFATIKNDRAKRLSALQKSIASMRQI